MSPVERQLYARHLLLAEIGECGQECLCATQVTLPADADERAASLAGEYLQRAGVRVDESGRGAPGSLQVPLPPSAGVAALAQRPELLEAAAALAGAFAAVETIKA